MFSLILQKIRTRLTQRGDYVGRPADDSLPSVADIYTFQTSPFCEFSAQGTGRFAAFKVIGLNENYVAVAVLNGVWNTRPSLNLVRKAMILRECRFSCENELALFGVGTERWLPSKLNDTFYLGAGRISDEERRFATQIVNFSAGFSYANVNSIDSSAEGEWRWRNDRNAVVAEWEKQKANEEELRTAQEERYQKRLRKLTWNQLLSETTFERWAESPPFPPKEFAEAARKCIKDATLKLKELGPKAGKSGVRKVLKECVEWFNQAARNAGGVIETEEREDTCAVLEELAFVARQKSLVAEIDSWRDW